MKCRLSRCKEFSGADDTMIDDTDISKREKLDTCRITRAYLEKLPYV